MLATPTASRPSPSARVLHTAMVWGWHAGGHEEARLLAARDRGAQRHRLGRGRRLVQQGRVGDLHARQLRDHRLEVEQALQAALRDLGLVGRVLRVPPRVLQHVALDHGRQVGAIVAHADEVLVQLVLRRHGPARGGAGRGGGGGGRGGAGGRWAAARCGRAARTRRNGRRLRGPPPPAAQAARRQHRRQQSQRQQSGRAPAHLKSSRNSLSVMPCVYRPMSMPSLRRMDAGTVASMSASIDAKPVSATIASSSGPVVLLWRGTKLRAAGGGGRVRVGARGWFGARVCAPPRLEGGEGRGARGGERGAGGAACWRREPRRRGHWVRRRPRSGVAQTHGSQQHARAAICCSQAAAHNHRPTNAGRGARAPAAAAPRTRAGRAGGGAAAGGAPRGAPARNPPTRGCRMRRATHTRTTHARARARPRHALVARLQRRQRDVPRARKAEGQRGRAAACRGRAGAQRAACGRAAAYDLRAAPGAPSRGLARTCRGQRREARDLAQTSARDIEDLDLRARVGGVGARPASGQAREAGEAGGPHGGRVSGALWRQWAAGGGLGAGAGARVCLVPRPARSCAPTSARGSPARRRARRTPRPRRPGPHVLKAQSAARRGAGGEGGRCSRGAPPGADCAAVQH